MFQTILSVMKNWTDRKCESNGLACNFWLNKLPWNNLHAKVILTQLQLWMAGFWLPYNTFVYLIQGILSCSCPTVFIAGILCCQGKVAEIDTALEGSDKPYVGKESSYWPLLQSSSEVLYYICAAHGGKHTLRATVGGTSAP